jgi:hypothetical protein
MNPNSAQFNEANNHTDHSFFKHNHKLHTLKLEKQLTASIAQILTSSSLVNRLSDHIIPEGL